MDAAGVAGRPPIPTNNAVCLADCPFPCGFNVQLIAAPRRSSECPLGGVTVGKSAGKVAITYGYPSLASLLSPATKLAATKPFQHAKALLPAGSTVPFYVNFAGISALSGLDRDKSHAQLWRTVKKLLEMAGG